uniref:CSON013105 protein n=1 Tax=Culicoides sonorensis TaxID=179676 RepID=A0A336M9W5_CULSO
MSIKMFFLKIKRFFVPQFSHEFLQNHTFFNNPDLKFNLLQMNFIGLLRDRQVNPQIIVSIILSFILEIQMILGTGQLDKMTLAIAVCALSILTACVIKLLDVAIARQKYFKFFQHYHNLQELLRQNGYGNANEILNRLHLMSQRISMFNLISCWISAILLVLLGLTSFSSGLIYFTWAPFDQLHGFGYFVTFLFQV